METEVAATLTDTILGQPPLLKGWILILMLTHYIGVVFVVVKTSEGWRVRYEAIAIVASFVASAAFMEWLYSQYGYAGILGLAHLVFWLPAYIWVLLRQRAIGFSTVFGKYTIFYLVVAGVSLVLDAVDVVGYLSEAS